MFQWLSLILPLTLGISVAQADEPHRPLSPHPPGTAREVVDQLILSLTGEPFDTNHEISRVVGSPWTLEPGTITRLGQLAPRVRFQIYAALAEIGTQAIPSELSSEIWSLNLPAGTSQAFVSRVSDSVLEHFSTEELLDLGVFALSKLPFFPRTELQWDRFKSRLAAGDVWLALGYLASAAAFDSAIFHFTGKLIQFGPEDSWRLGWVAEVRGFGFHLEPLLQGGLQLQTPQLEVRAGVTENWGAGAAGDRRSIELSVLEHFLRRYTSPLGWELSLALRAQSILSNPGSMEREGRWTGIIDAYTRRKYAGGIPTLSFMAHFLGQADTDGHLAGQLDLGIEDEAHHLVGALRLSSSPETHLGAFVGGSLENDAVLRNSQIIMRQGRIRELLDTLRRSDSRLRRWEQSFLGLAAPRSLRELKSALAAETRARTGWIAALERNTRILTDLCLGDEVCMGALEREADLDQIELEYRLGPSIPLGAKLVH